MKNAVINGLADSNVYAQVDENQSILCVPNLNSNKSSDECSINNTDESITNQL